MLTLREFQEKFGIIGKSKEIKDLIDISMQVASSDISVLIYGESGVGKEVFARAIHGYSGRSDKKLVSVNCGAIPEGILESELFGHTKGAFTGAVENRKGYFEIADGGTLFLDEIAEMPLMTQVKLLRVLETKEFMRIGGETVTRVDVRIIAATNKNLQKEVDARRFRNDLFFRLKAVTINIPPLRERREDIRELINHFLGTYNEPGTVDPVQISQDGIDLLYNYSWPGNIRELKNALNTAVALSKSRILTKESFIPLLNINKYEDNESRNLPVHLGKSKEELDREMLYRALIDIKRDLVDIKNIVYKYDTQMQENGTRDQIDEIVTMESLEKKALKNALIYTKGNKRKAARLLGISERTFYRKLKEYEI